MDETPTKPQTEGEGDGTLARLKAARRTSGAVFGDTPIEMPPAPEAQAQEAEQDEEPSLEPRVRSAAIAAALKTVALSACAGILMGVVLFCSLSGLMGGGWSVFLGLVVAGIAIPVAIVGGFSSYRQTLETERHRVGLCPRCGYDLRGTLGTRCPECGTRIRAPGSSRAPWSDEEQRREEYQ